MLCIQMTYFKVVLCENTFPRIVLYIVGVYSVGSVGDFCVFFIGPKNLRNR